MTYAIKTTVEEKMAGLTGLLINQSIIRQINLLIKQSINNIRPIIELSNQFIHGSILPFLVKI